MIGEDPASIPDPAPETLPIAIPASKLIGRVAFANLNIQAAIDHALDSLPPSTGDITIRVGLNRDGQPKLGLIAADRIGEHWSIVAVAEVSMLGGRIMPEGAIEIHGSF